MSTTESSISDTLKPLSTAVSFNDRKNVSEEQNVFAAKAQEEVVSDRQTLCIDILVSGCVNSFVDFFYLTHRSNDAVAKIETEQMETVRQHLVKAEKSHRRGDSESVYDAYEKLADYFQSIKDYKTAIYFYEKCLDIAESMDDLAQQGNSNLHLGLTHDAMGKTALAIKFHERHLQIATEMDEPSRLAMANRQLVETYEKFASTFAAKPGAENLASAVSYYKKCCQASADCSDLESEGRATYQLGLAAAKMGDKEQAIDYQRRYLEICKQLDDQKGEGNACYALARSFKQMGETKLSIRYLERYLDVATRNKMLDAQCHACAALGQLYSESENHEKAVNYLERTFEIARSIGDRKLIDEARINLGMARGNMAINPYMNVVQTDLNALLQWKTKRMEFV